MHFGSVLFEAQVQTHNLLHFSKWAELSGEKQEINSSGFVAVWFKKNKKQKQNNCQGILPVRGVTKQTFVNLFASLAYVQYLDYALWTFLVLYVAVCAFCSIN